MIIENPSTDAHYFKIERAWHETTSPSAHPTSYHPYQLGDVCWGMTGSDYDDDTSYFIAVFFSGGWRYLPNSTINQWKIGCDDINKEDKLIGNYYHAPDSFTAPVLISKEEYAKLTKGIELEEAGIF